MSYGSPLLSIVQEVCSRTNLPRPTTVSGSTDPQYLQMMSLLNEELEEVGTRFQWQEFLYQISFLSQGQSDQGDIDTICGFKVNFVLNDVMWNATTRLPVFGPVEPQRWEQYKALPITGTLLQYRIENNHLLFYPLTTVPVGHTILFEASSALMVIDPTTNPVTFKQRYSKDTDVVPLSDAHMMAALRWRYKREKGLTYAEDKARYEGILSDRMSRNGTGRILNMNGDEENFGPGILVPSGSWNVQGGGIPGGSGGP